MSVIVQNEQFRATFSEVGAEWTSWLDVRDGRELLWQGDPAVWAGQAPILFPVIGVQHGDAIRVDGVTYPHPKHGFFRRRTCTVVQQAETEVTFELRSDAQTRSHFPFDFAFRVRYTLDGPTLHHTFEVENTGDRPMPFHLGGHPAFNLFGASYVEFDQPETASIYGISPTGLLLPDATPYLNDERRIPITPATFLPDALVFKSLVSKGIELVSEDSDTRIRVEYQGFPYLGLWAKPGASYVCIEPWIGCADTVGREGEMAEKEAIVWAAPGETRTFRFSVTALQG